MCERHFPHAEFKLVHVIRNEELIDVASELSEANRERALREYVNDYNGAAIPNGHTRVGLMDHLVVNGELTIARA